MIRRVLLAAVACLLLGAAPAAAATPPEFYGVNSGSALFSRPTRDAQLDLMARAGIDVVRTDASWSAIEPDAPVAGVHRFRWDSQDAVVAALASHGLRYYPVLAYSAPWAAAVRGDLFSGPRDPATFAAFAGAVARRYGRGGVFWAQHPELPYRPVESYEIWNEPNFQQFWHDQADAPERMADLYLAARAAIKAADPQAEAVVGGLTDFGPAAFVDRMFASRPDLKGRVDAFGFHPYQQRGGVVATVRRFRERLDRLGAKGVPIEVTEIGWPSSDIPEAWRAQLIARATRKLRVTKSLRVTRVMPYVWSTSDYALAREDGTLTAAGNAFLIAIAAELGPQRRILGRPEVVHASAKRRGSRRSRRR